MGSIVEIVNAKYHDKILAITSHLPHLIAYTIVGTASDLETDLKNDVIKLSYSIGSVNLTSFQYFIWKCF